MKVIKLKAWDKLNNQMLEVLQICFDDRGLPYLKVGIVGRIGTNQYNLKMEDIELMQFIEAEDKNKKDIYSGYILRTNEAGWIGAVYFHDGRFYLEDNKGGFSYRPDWDLCEVIGNIWENGDLLK